MWEAAGYLCSLSVKHLKGLAASWSAARHPQFYDCVRVPLSSSAACDFGRCLICLQWELLHKLFYLRKEEVFFNVKDTLSCRWLRNAGCYVSPPPFFFPAQTPMSHSHGTF